MKLLVFVTGVAMMLWVFFDFHGSETTLPQMPARTAPAASEKPATPPACCPAQYLSATSVWLQYRNDPALSGRVDALPGGNMWPAWQYKTAAAIKSGIALYRRRVYFADTSGTIFALRGESGSEIWRRNLGESINAPLLVLSFDDHARLYVGNRHGVFFAIDSRSGRTLWKFETRGEISAGAIGAEIDGRRVVMFASHDSHLYCLDADTGEEIWKLKADSYLNASPVIDGQTLYLSGCDGFVRTISVANGSETTSVDLESYIPAAPALSDKVLYLNLHDSRILALDAEQGEIIWTIQPGNAAEFYAPPVVNDQFVISADADGRIWVINRHDGTIARTLRVSGEIRSEPLIDDSSLIIADTDGIIYCFAISSGKELWRIAHHAAVAAPLAVGDGHLFVADMNGMLTLYAPRKDLK